MRTLASKEIIERIRSTTDLPSEEVAALKQELSREELLEIKEELIRSEILVFRDLSEAEKEQIILKFHMLYYHTHMPATAYGNAHWLGVKAWKCPLDLWNYQEIIYDTQPDLIIETGTHLGGSAIYLATICDLVQRGRVVSVDILQHEGRPVHDRITYVAGSSTAPDTVSKVEAMIREGERVMVLLDSAHEKQHVLEELKIYSHFVTKGNYLIVEDTNLNGHPVVSHFGPGPREARDEFLASGTDFVVDASKDKYFMSFNPGGNLLRVK